MAKRHKSRKRKRTEETKRIAEEKARRTQRNLVALLVVGMLISFVLMVFLTMPSDEENTTNYVETPQQYERYQDTGSSSDDSSGSDSDSGSSDSSDSSGSGDGSQGEIAIPLSDLGTTAKFYTYITDDGVTVKYFAVIGSDGQPHTAFDACEVCYDAKKGYYQDGEDMVCRNCGNRYLTNQMGTANKGGGCWPGYLESSVVGNEVIISFEELEAGKWFFA